MLIRRDRVMLAVTIMLDVAFHGGRSTTVSAADLANRVGLARRGMEPLLQTLSRAGLLESVRGPRGGYRLGRPRRDIKLSEILAAVGADDSPAEAGPSGKLQTLVVDRVWSELEDDARARFGKLTLEDMTRRAQEAGLRRPTSEPISFVI
jgi:Rrf2 family iron-sulfur cluster assembly transcriptional regulator